ncbi:MAG TPA: hypothetical protein VGO54_13965 [Bradyrhizobium sp.]|jgi:hypothetical protein|nr:hypothetical protein [Bradyrhizobium sp.]
MTDILGLVRSSDLVAIGRIETEVDPDLYPYVAVRCHEFASERVLYPRDAPRPLFVVSEPLATGRRLAPLLLQDGRYLCFLRRGEFATAVATALGQSANAVWELTDTDSALQLAGQDRDVPASTEFRRDAGVDPMDNPEEVIAVVETACRYTAARANEERAEVVRAVAARRGPLWDWLRGSLQRDQFDRSRR